MTRLYWAMLLIGFCSSSESTIIVKEPGEIITLKCSSEGCPQNIDGFVGMYLYHNFTKQNEVYFYSNHINSKATVRARYEGKIETEGSFMNHNITMTNLTVDDSGVYSCVYKKFNHRVECNVYTVFIREVAPCPGQDDLRTLVLVVITCTFLSVLLNIIFILLIVHKVKQGKSCRRSSRSSQQEPDDYVYEVMTKNNLYSLSTSPQQSQSPYEFS
ncbi:unnamed protein product [Oreochromis niloticus]|nr:unnamed protein product [Mustela putorius furo]